MARLKVIVEEKLVGIPEDELQILLDWARLGVSLSVIGRLITKQSSSYAETVCEEDLEIINRWSEHFDLERINLKK